ncbi:MAG: DUF350 domain-containing protein [Bacteroidetes bacterium]|nr:DUF350 domain-containing protein [Bacteroidota bacterium]
MEYINLHAVLSSVIFSLLGTALLLVSFWIIEKLTPENTWKEISHNKNVALAIVMGAFILGMSIIIGCAIHG